MAASKTEADKRSEEERKRIREMEIKKAQEFIAEENARKRKEHQDARKAENEKPYVNKKAKKEINKIDFSSWLKSLTNQFKGLLFQKINKKKLNVKYYHLILKVKQLKKVIKRFYLYMKQKHLMVKW